MGLFPQSFIEDLRAQADIVQVIQDHVPLKRVGNTWKGLCPFHAEKTPSFHVNREKGFFHCFGCTTGGDVFKFVELQEKVGFADAVKLLAARFGMTVPETSDTTPEDAAEREALIKVHELAAEWFRQQLRGPAGGRARKQLAERGIEPATIEALGLGFAPSSRDALRAHLNTKGLSLPLLVKSGLVVAREDGQVLDRFRGRLMIPIARDSGTVVAFGGRAMEAEQQPKYLNSPETAIYSKSRTLYGLHLTKGTIRRVGYAVMVEGYFDFAQAFQAGSLPVVASCGTALTAQQGQLLKRFASKVVLSFDPDAAGQGAAARSCELLVAEGFQVNVALLPGGDDPDGFIRKHGGQAYAQQLKASRPWLEYLLDRTAARYDLKNDDSRREFLHAMLGIAARIPDAAGRDQFADRLAHKARITEDVVRAEIRKAAVERRTTVTVRELPGLGRVKPAERGIIWALMQGDAEAVTAVAQLEEADLEGLASASVLEVARTLHPYAPADVPTALLERLSTGEVTLVSGIASDGSAAASVEECIRALKRLRYERERTALQQEIDRLQESGADEAAAIERLWTQKKDLLHRIEALGEC